MRMSDAEFQDFEAFRLSFNKLSREVSEFRRKVEADAARWRARQLERRFNPNQPRVGAGVPEGGQFVGANGLSSGMRDDGPAAKPSGNIVLAGYSFGILIAEIPVPGGRRCVYKFDFGSVVVPGAVHLGCSTEVPSSAVTHGYMLNDNYKCRGSIYCV
jgi:hypothetical protein